MQWKETFLLSNEERSPGKMRVFQAVIFVLFHLFYLQGTEAQNREYTLTILPSA